MRVRFFFASKFCQYMESARVQNGILIDHSIAGYLCWARDQIPTFRGDVSRWGARTMTYYNEFKEIADLVAQGYKQCGQRCRRNFMAEAESGRPHDAFSDPTPYECQVLIDALNNEKKQIWCVDEYAECEELDDDGLA